MPASSVSRVSSATGAFCDHQRPYFFHSNLAHLIMTQSTPPEKIRDPCRPKRKLLPGTNCFVVEVQCFSSRAFELRPTRRPELLGVLRFPFRVRTPIRRTSFDSSMIGRSLTASREKIGSAIGGLQSGGRVE
jgi:hypothetical protein